MKLRKLGAEFTLLWLENLRHEQKNSFKKSLFTILQNGGASRSKVMRELPEQFESSLFVHISHRITFNYDCVLLLLSEGPFLYSVLRIDDRLLILFRLQCLATKPILPPAVHTLPMRVFCLSLSTVVIISDCTVWSESFGLTTSF